MEMQAVREVRRPADEVFDFFADASNNPLWQKGMRECRWTSEPPISTGSTYEQHARFLGRDVRTTFVVSRHTPGRLIAIESVESTFPIAVERRVIATEGGSCRVSAVIRGGPNNRVAKFFEPVIRTLAQRSVDRDYDRLVAHLESGT